MRFDKVFPISPSDANEVSADAFLVETDGEIRVEFVAGGDAVIPVKGGTIYPIRFKKVYYTGTSGVGDVFGLI